MHPVEALSVIAREFPFALWGSLLVGMSCAFLGVYVVSRRVVFFGAVLTQVSVLGLAVTFLPFVAIPHTLGSLLATLAVAILLSRLLTGKHVPRDAILGTVFVAAVAGRILVLQLAPRVETAEIEGLLRGDILFVTPELFVMMAATFLIAMGIHLLFFKEFVYVTFDAETARTQGLRAGRWDTLFYVIAGGVISVATHMVGDIFVFGFLVIPPVTAMLLCRRVTTIFAVSTLLGALCPVAGLVLAFIFDLPASPAIVAVAFALLLLSWGVHVARN